MDINNEVPPREIEDHSTNKYKSKATIASYKTPYPYNSAPVRSDILQDTLYICTRKQVSAPTSWKILRVPPPQHPLGWSDLSSRPILRKCVST
jgi:hypothetical protein